MPTAFGIASALLLIKEHAVCWKKLVEVVEIPDIARQNRPSAFERLKVEARIVQQERPFASLDAEKARYQAGKHPGFTRRGLRGCREAMGRNVVDRASYLAQHRLCAGMRWIEASEQMRYLREADGRVIDDPRFQQLIDARRRAAL